MIIGLDVGGTNIDAVIIEKRQIISKVKTPLYENDLLGSVLITLDELLRGQDRTKIKRINLSTTVCTNAIVTNELSSVGMLIQSGPGLPVDFLACGDENKFLSGSIDHRGRVIQDIDRKEVEDSIDLFKKNKVEACAIITKFSTRNPSHEITIKNMLDKHFKFNTTGHSLSGELNFPRRVYTAYLNSAIHETFNNFASNIKQSLNKQNINVPVYILKADGGTMDMSSARKEPVETILSGPAASFMGISALLPTDKDSLFLDIGGTTTDIFFLVNGIPLFKPLGITIDQYKTLIRSIYSVSIGVGGDSHIHIEDGNLRIGPHKAKKAYALGGNDPTPTDAMIFLNLIDTGDKQRAGEAMKKLGGALGLSENEAAKLILETMADIIKAKVDELLEKINSKPIYTVKEILNQRKLEPEIISIVGGPAKSLSSILEERFGIPCVYPSNYQIANAVGAALAKPTKDITVSADTQRKKLSIPELGIYEDIQGTYNLHMAKKQAIDLLNDHIQLMNPDGMEINKKIDKEIEIMEESTFNMVDGFHKTGENIRVKAQVKPGPIYRLRSVDQDDEG